MAAAFDPYHRWLGIPPAEQPPHFYRLLGLRVLEDDPDVIENAADQRLSHLRTFQAGAHADACAKLLNQVSAAKVTLLNPEKKAIYDQQLQAQLAPPHAEPVAVPVASPAPPPLPMPMQGGRRDAASEAPYGVPTAGQLSMGSKVRTGRRRSSSMAALGGTVVVLALVVGAAALVAFRSSSPTESTETALAFNWPADQRAGATLKIDGHSVDLPAAGSYHYACEPGDHDLEICRSGYETIRQKVHVDAASTREVSVVWVKATGGETTSGDLPHGQFVDLLPRVDPAVDKISGTWTREGTQLLVTSDRDACLALPVRIDADHYVFQTIVSFKTFGSAEFCLSCGPRRFNLVVAGSEVRLSKADGKEIIQPLPKHLRLYSPQQIEAEVVRGAEQTEIRLSLGGGPPLLAWKGDEKVLTGWRLPDRRRPALGAHAGELVYHAARLKIVEGSASWIEGREKPQPGAQPPVVVSKPPEKPPEKPPTPPESGLPVTVTGMNPVPFRASGSGPVPAFLEGATTFDFPQKPSTDSRHGVLKFVVNRDCVLYLLAHWKNEGNPSGVWYEQRLTRQQLVERGWRDLGPVPWDKEVVAFEKPCRRGETYEIRTNKYWPPTLIVPAPGYQPPEQPAIAQTPEEKPTEPAEPIEPVEPQQELLAVPSDADQKPVRDQLEEIYKVSKADTAPRRAELAREMARVSDESRDQAVERYVLLDTAVRMAAAAGDAPFMLETANKLADAFQIDEAKYRTDAMVALAGAVDDANDIRSLYNVSQQVIDGAMDERRYDLAAQVASAVSRACQQPAGAPLRKQAYDRQQAVNELFQQWQKGQQAIDTLKASPDDPEANLAAGRWYCLSDGDWPRGLACLAKGSDEKLKSPAAKDLAASPTDASGRIDLADAWWDAAQTAGQDDKRLMLTRAKYWYQQARAGDLASLLAMKVDKRLEEIKPQLDEGRDLPSAAPTANLFETGKFVDMLPYVDPARDGVGGTWQQIGDDLMVTSGSDCRLRLPFAIDGSYDFEIEFVRNEGDGPVAMIFPVGSRQVAVVFSVDEGKYSGMELIDNHAANHRRNSTRRQPGILQNGRRYTVLVGVRLIQGGARIDVVVNGKKYIRSGGTLDGLSLPSHWDLNNDACPGLGADHSAVKFSKARLRMVEGKTTPLAR